MNANELINNSHTATASQLICHFVQNVSIYSAIMLLFASTRCFAFGIGTVVERDLWSLH